MNYQQIIKSTADYFSTKIEKYKDNPLGVDWNSVSAQEIRQDQILKIIKTKKNFSLNDIGCGYGHLFKYMKKKKFSNFIYKGSDISPEMIKFAKIKNKKSNIQLKLISSIDKITTTDYCVASGIFNMKQKEKTKVWQTYVLKSLSQINQKSLKGFSFNMLTSYSNKKFRRSDLYYGDPVFYFDFCKKNFSKNVTLLHDYGLYDFTILVRR
jgi:SAM-dependent methyltransferase|tara:strand:- start:77 stop:706 length:630 start_codon:yes stop_codon:yes gene_type:complete